jgi:hypothetical protein
MDEFRALSRAFNAAGEIEPTSLHGLLDAMAGIQTGIVGLSNLINEITGYADVEMWVDPRVLRPMYDAANNVLAETSGITAAITQLRRLYEPRLQAEEEAAKPAAGAPRKLNPAKLEAA